MRTQILKNNILRNIRVFKIAFLIYILFSYYFNSLKLYSINCNKPTFFPWFSSRLVNYRFSPPFWPNIKVAESVLLPKKLYQLGPVPIRPHFFAQQVCGRIGTWPKRQRSLIKSTDSALKLLSKFFFVFPLYL